MNQFILCEYCQNCLLNHKMVDFAARYKSSRTIDRRT